MLTPHQNRAHLHSIDAEAINAFGLDVYSHLASARGNLLFSPFSVYEALGLAFAGAGGRTLEQMAAVLRSKIDQRDNPASAQLGIEKCESLIVANAAWAQRGFDFLPSYFSRVTGPYRAELFQADFIGAAEQARLAINAWAEAKTVGKIKNLIPPGGVSDLTRLVLSNAVYLEVQWFDKFDPAKTEANKFHLASGQCIRVPTMHNTCRLVAVEEDWFDIVQLQYVQDEISMQIYLPRDPADFSWLEQKLLATGPAHWQREMSLHTVTLSLPRFRIESDHYLGGILASMGMADAFSPDTADFTGMANLPHPSDPPIVLTEVFHKTFIEVDEEGTRAAATTAVVLTGGASSSPPLLDFNADHPFLFTICANSPQYRAPTLLFMGRVMNPVGIE